MAVRGRRGRATRDGCSGGCSYQHVERRLPKSTGAVGAMEEEERYSLALELALEYDVERSTARRSLARRSSGRGWIRSAAAAMRGAACWLRSYQPRTICAAV